MFTIQVDFFWINRDQISFEWFVKLLTEMEMEQAETGGQIGRYYLLSYQLVYGRETSNGWFIYDSKSRVVTKYKI